MHIRTASVVASALVVGICVHASTRVGEQVVAGVIVRVDFLKTSSFEREVQAGPVLVGPQSALELEWRLTNTSDEPHEIPSPEEVFRLRVVSEGQEIPVTTNWAAAMTLRTTQSGGLRIKTVPTGPLELLDSSTLAIRGSTKRVDGAPFGPRDYVVELDVSELEARLSGATGTVPRVDRGFPIRLHIADLTSPERQRQFHIIEGGFYEGIDRERAIPHYIALASLPEAPWSDSLALARVYASLGRHRDAMDVYRRIIPELIRGLDSPFGHELIRKAGHLRRAATSFAVEGDVATAGTLLRLEGLTPEDQIPAAIERLRLRAPKAVTAPRK